MKIAVTKPLSETGMAYARSRAEVIVLDSVDKEEVLEKITREPVDALIARWFTLDADFIARAAAAGCKVLARFATGLDKCDISAATEHRIPLVYAFGANAHAVAEYTVSLMLSVFKSITYCDRHSHTGDFVYGKGKYLSRDFYGKNVYIVGFGNIGRQVGGMCRALGMSIAAYDKYMPRERVEAEGAKWCENLYDGLADADIVSIHMPLTGETEKIVNEEFFSRMKDGAVFINTARGGLVDEEALVHNLKNEKLRAAGLDASSADDGKENHKLWGCENLTLSAHVAAMTEEALAVMAEYCVDGIQAVLEKKRWRITANPEVYDLLGWEK